MYCQMALFSTLQTCEVIHESDVSKRMTQSVGSIRTILLQGMHLLQHDGDHGVNGNEPDSWQNKISKLLD